MPRTKKCLIHLINPMENSDGGSEWRTIELYKHLKNVADVHLWASGTPHDDFADFPIRMIEDTKGAFPTGGTMVFIGCYKQFGPWILKARSNRTVLIYNVLLPDMLARSLLYLSSLESRIEMVYPSQMMQRAVGFPGVVQPSLIDLNKFSPVERTDEDTKPFIVGRLSRDTEAKHFMPDESLYNELTRNGCSIKLMGGTLWSAQLGNNPNIELIPTLAEPPEQFIQSLGCFYYRTHENWLEPSGRVITEAMACGVPVVAHEKGGYSEWIDHGRDGFLFSTQRQALQYILDLKNDPALRQQIGQAAREKALEIFSQDERDKVTDFYLSQSLQSSD
ncbi:MAG: glycosyltransferase family 4 protein [Methylocystaceae bacterium]|nr:glycosyltransferase family 4 protein [Methylocystaceae bacterium]